MIFLTDINLHIYSNEKIVFREKRIFVDNGKKVLFAKDNRKGDLLFELIFVERQLDKEEILDFGFGVSSVVY